MASLAQSGAFDIDASALAAMRQDFAGVRVLEHETEAEIRATHAVSGYVLDPHTAVGVAAARRALKRDPRTPMIAIGAAHPAKFGDAVAKATGERPRLPAHLADLLERRERVTILPNDQAKVETFIRSHARAVRGAAA